MTFRNGTARYHLSFEDQFNEKAFNLNGSLKHERKLNVFKWLPKHERPSQFPLLPKPYWPNKETRKSLANDQ